MSVPVLTSSRTLNLSELTGLVQDVAANGEAWEHLVRFDPRARWWARLYADDDVDVWLLGWLTSQSTELHDHGPSAAAFTVVTGTLEEVRVGRTRRLRTSSMGTGATRALAPGVVHDVRNLADRPAVSIHAYSPPLTNMTYYRHERGKLTAARTQDTTVPDEVGQP